MFTCVWLVFWFLVWCDIVWVFSWCDFMFIVSWFSFLVYVAVLVLLKVYCDLFACSCCVVCLVLGLRDLVWLLVFRFWWGNLLGALCWIDITVGYFICLCVFVVLCGPCLLDLVVVVFACGFVWIGFATLCCGDNVRCGFYGLCCVCFVMFRFVYVPLYFIVCVCLLILLFCLLLAR